MLPWNPAVKLGDFFTGLSVLVAISGFMYAWVRDARLKQKEYADRIRRSAAETVVALRRWQQLALRFYEDIQPLITEADVNFVKNQHNAKDATEVRDFFWQGLVLARTASSQRILDERIESAYVGLYGYEPHVQALFDWATAALNRFDEEAFHILLNEAQQAISLVADAPRPFLSAQLGNQLRFRAGQIESSLSAKLRLIVETFRNEMLRLITATDSEIAKKRVRVATSLDQPD